MGMFDWYKPRGELGCPVCAAPLREWQGKDADCLLFVWQEGRKHPSDQDATDPDFRMEPGGYEEYALPPHFLIDSYDCPDHQPIRAYCTTDEQQTWTETLIVPYQPGPFDSHSLWFTRWLKDVRSNLATPHTG